MAKLEMLLLIAVISTQGKIAECLGKNTLYKGKSKETLSLCMATLMTLCCLTFLD